MFKIAGTLPVKTRLPFAAWALAGLATLFSLVTSLTQVSSFAKLLAICLASSMVSNSAMLA